MVVGSNAGIIAGGAGGCSHSSRSRIHLPRRVGECESGCEVADQQAALAEHAAAPVVVQHHLVEAVGRQAGRVGQAVVLRQRPVRVDVFGGQQVLRRGLAGQDRAEQRPDLLLHRLPHRRLPGREELRVRVRPAASSRVCIHCSTMAVVKPPATLGSPSMRPTWRGDLVPGWSAPSARPSGTARRPACWPRRSTRGARPAPSCPAPARRPASDRPRRGTGSPAPPARPPGRS